MGSLCGGKRRWEVLQITRLSVSPSFTTWNLENLPPSLLIFVSFYRDLPLHPPIHPNPSLHQVRPPAPVRIHPSDEQRAKVTDLVIDNFDVTIGGKELVQNTTLKIVIGRKYGLHGRNGTGKTCLLATLAKKDHPKIPKSLHIVTVEQDIDHLASEELGPIDFVLEVDVERTKLMTKIAELEKGIEEGSRREWGGFLPPNNPR